MKRTTPGTVAVWFRQDLRVGDHPALLAAATHAQERGNAIVGVYCLEDREFSASPLLGLPRTGPVRARFLLESLAALRGSLRELGSELIIRRGEPAQVLGALARDQGWERLDFHQLVGTEERDVEGRVRTALEAQDVVVRAHWDRTLHDDYPFPLEELPGVFTAFRKSVEKKAEIAAPLGTPASLRGPDQVDAGEVPTLKALGLQTTEPDPRAVLVFRGGETAALERLRSFVWNGSLSTYKTTRNGLIGADYSSKLSPWLALGCVSCRTVQAEVQTFEREQGANDSTYWMTFELLWRDYFQLIVQKHGAAVFQPGGLQRFPIRWKHDMDTFEAWRLGRTGYPFVDGNMRELLATGYMSNRGRQNVGSFLTKNLGLDWRLGAEWFESQLIDHDVASNYGNWNYVAGVGNDARGFRYFHIPKQAEMYDPEGKHARLWIPELSAGYVNAIVDLEESQEEQRAAWRRAAGLLPHEPR